MASLLKSTGIVALSTLGSRILGLLRDILMASFFGASRVADVFFVAFMIPNLFRRLVAEGALTISFVPVYTETLHRDGEEVAGRLARRVMSIQGLAVILIVLLGMFFSPEIMGLFFKRFDSTATFNLATDLTRIMFPYLFFVSFVAFSMGYLNCRGHFFAPAFAPVLLNVGIISGIVFFSTFFDIPIYGVAIGVLFGGVMQMFLQVPYLLRHGFRFGISINFKDRGIKKIFKMLGPALFGIAVYQINILVNNVLATMLPEGSVTYIYFTNRLTELVLGVFIVSIGSVVLPEMSRLKVSGAEGDFRKLFTDSLSAALFLAVPAAVALATIGLEIVSLLFMGGNFSFADSVSTYHALVTASVGIVFVAMLRITTQASYSMKDTKTPVKTATLALVINIVLGYILMNTGLRHAGLTLANSISAMVQCFILLFVVSRRSGGINMGRLFHSVLRFILSSAVMAVAVVYLSHLANWSDDSFLHRAGVMALMVAAGGAVYFIMNLILGTREMVFFMDRLRARLR